MLEEYLMNVRHAELQDEARKIHQAAQIKPIPSAAITTFMVSAGKLLQSWGTRLEARYRIENTACLAGSTDCGLEV